MLGSVVSLILQSVCVACILSVCLLGIGLLFNDILFKQTINILLPSFPLTIGLGVVSVSLKSATIALFTCLEACLFFQAYRILQQTLSDLIATVTSVHLKHFALLILLPELLKLLPVAKAFALHRHDAAKRRVAVATVALGASLAFSAMSALSQKVAVTSPLCHVVCGLIDIAVLFKANSGVMLLPALCATCLFMYSVVLLTDSAVWAAAGLGVTVALAALGAIAAQTMNVWASEVAMAVRERRMTSSMSQLSKLRFYAPPELPVSVSTSPSV